MHGEEDSLAHREEDHGGSSAPGPFELRVLAQPAAPVDGSTLQNVVESLREDLDMILEAWVLEFEAPSVEPPEDTVLAALFSTTVVPSLPP